MRGKRANDDGLELLKLLARHGRLFDFQFGGEQAAQRVSLVDGKRGNDTARIRDGFQPLALAWRQLHFFSLTCTYPRVVEPRVRAVIDTSSLKKKGESTSPLWQSSVDVNLKVILSRNLTVQWYQQSLR